MQTNHATLRRAPIFQLAGVQMSFTGSRLRAQRERKRMTQQEIADALGIKVPSYSDYERGERDPSADRLVQLCEVLSCSADYLLGFVDEPAQTLELSTLRPDERKLLELYHDKRIPRFLRQLLGDPEFLRRDSSAAQIE